MQPAPLAADATSSPHKRPHRGALTVCPVTAGRRPNWTSYFLAGTYDPHTGRNLHPRRVFPASRANEIEGIPTYDVREADGWVYVGPRSEPPVG